ncbi:MAG: hypothetical protein ACOY3I_02085 [Verrucomicrobiota bacterium]
MTTVSFQEAGLDLLKFLLGNPATSVELLVTMAVVWITMLMVLFQTQIYFGAPRATAPVTLMALALVVGGVFAGVVATRCYVFPLMPSEWFETLHRFTGMNQETMEGSLLFLTAVLLLFAGGCPLTASLFNSYQRHALWSWIFCSIAAALVIFATHWVFATTRSADHVGSTWKNADQQWREEAERISKP